MSTEETVESRQNNELEALQGIYGEDVKDLRDKSGGNKWSPLNLSITLTPLQGSSGTTEFYVKIDLHVICNEDYPASSPIIFLENGLNLSNAKIAQLTHELELRAKELQGSEMIYDLSQYVQDFLHKHNKPGTKSFYEEMIERQKEREQQRNLMEENTVDLFLIEEVQRRQEILQSESRLRRESRFSPEISDEELEENRNKTNTSSTEGSDESLCEHKNTVLITFGDREIQRGRCIKHSSPNHVLFYGLDKSSGELLAISEWTITPKNNDLVQIQKNISSIEQEFNYLLKIRHLHLTNYLYMKQETVDNKIVVQILQEFIIGVNCKSLFLTQNLTIDVKQLKPIARFVLLALEFLHRNNVVHRSVRESNIYITKSGIVKLNNYSIHRRLTDLTSQVHTNFNRKTDIYSFGTFLLSLLTGECQSEDNIEIPTSIPPDLYDLISRCVTKDEKDRYTAMQLSKHSFFKSTTTLPSPAQVEHNDIQRTESPEVLRTDLLLAAQANGQNRIKTEFDFMQHLGRGAFGDVIKVKNKLDGRYYAIKRIQLNPKNKQLNKKIVREVKLLSRLNHENIVRYYNSWIETTTPKASNFDLSESEATTSTSPKKVKKKDFTIHDDVEALAPPINNVEISLKYDSKSQVPYSSSDEDSSDEENAWGTYNDDSESDDGIEFAEVSASENPAAEETKVSPSLNQTTESSTVAKEATEFDFMYIQMEFCEKSTLRTAIDNNLYQNDDRVWRLFREIVEGLTHIHQQGMIHRDLKPVNIFLDFEDHVKIGDFGLATNINTRQTEVITQPVVAAKDETEDETKTGQIGTTLYVAPEISMGSKAIYNEKVDIYSLGIIFFEMCYKPLPTTMERIMILNKLREKNIELPSDFSTNKTDGQDRIIKWLLNHDVTQRPTAQQLLESKDIPPPVLEERELRELVRHTLSNPQLKGYKYLIASCFEQALTTAQDITYDRDPSVGSKSIFLNNFVREKTIKVFKNHGGQNIATPLLMPKGKHYEGLESVVKIMTHFGSIVTLPHDLRVPFARYVAWNNVTLMRRYSIERVYREKKVFGFLPRELYECAFDIVSPKPGESLILDAEILYIGYKIITDLPGIKNMQFTIRLNHTLLLKAMFFCHGIKDKHDEILKALTVFKEHRRANDIMKNYLVTLGLSDASIAAITSFFNSDYEINKASTVFDTTMKNKTIEVGQLAEQAFRDLTVIVQNAQALGVNFKMVVAPSLVYNVQQYSGMMFQFVCKMTRKHKHSNLEVLAAGGRYDSMIEYYRKMMERAAISSRSTCQSAVGISISLDRIVQAMQSGSEPDALPKDEIIVFISVGSKLMLKEKAQIMKSLWEADVKYQFIEVANNQEMEEQITELKPTHAISIKGSEKGIVRVKSLVSGRLQEKQYAISAFTTNIQQCLNILNDCAVQPLQSVVRSDSKTSHSEQSQEANVDIIFVTVDKLNNNIRKRHENQIESHLDTFFKKLTGYVIVIGVTLGSLVIKALAAYLEFESEYQFLNSVGVVIDKHVKHKKYLNDVCDKIWEQKTKRSNPVIILYSLTDSTYKVII